MRRILMLGSLMLLVSTALLFTSTAGAQIEFRRGDADGDGHFAPIQDALFLINGLFSAGPVPCYDAQDFNDSGTVNIGDAVEILSFGYLSGPPPPAPGFESCGADPTDDGIGCNSYLTCDSVVPLLPNPELIYRVTSSSGQVGMSARVVIQLDNTSRSDIGGWSVGVCHDSAQLALDSVNVSPTLPFVPEFFEVRAEESRFVAGVLPTYLSGVGLEPAIGVGLFEVDYVLLSAGSAALQFCEDPSSPVRINHVVASFSQLALPMLESGTITIEDAPLFRRGDANGDGSFDVADPIFGLSHLFTGGAPPLCEDAGDSNDDGTLNVADAIHMLNALFDSGSAQPPLPGPGNCGVDPTVDTLDCDTHLGCPQ